MDGLFVMGQNPAVGAPNAALERRALAQLKWLVVRDMVEVETASFWKDSPEVTSGELDPRRIGTEVFFFPAAGHAEKDGSFTNTQRMLQWHEKAVDAPGDCRSDRWFVYHLGRRLKAKAAADASPHNDGLRALTWDYPTNGSRGEPDDGSGAAGNQRQPRRRPASCSPGSASSRTTDRPRAAAGSTPASSRPKAAIARDRARRTARTGTAGDTRGRDRRILYNRASARPDGRPWSERKKLVWWDETAGEWTGLDTPDSARTTPPPTAGRLADARSGMLRATARPFIMHADGLGWLWVPSGLKDGPLPTHYEPLESPVANPIYAQQAKPAADRRARPDNLWADSPDPRFPHVLTTYRLTEHHTAGGMSRTLSHLAELQPALFCEISPELAREVGLAQRRRRAHRDRARPHRSARARHDGECDRSRSTDAPCIRSRCPFTSDTRVSSPATS